MGKKGKRAKRAAKERSESESESDEDGVDSSNEEEEDWYKQALAITLGIGTQVVLPGSHYGFQHMNYDQTTRIPGTVVSYDRQLACWVVEYGPGIDSRGLYRHSTAFSLNSLCFISRIPTAVCAWWHTALSNDSAALG